MEKAVALIVAARQGTSIEGVTERTRQPNVDRWMSLVVVYFSSYLPQHLEGIQYFSLRVTMYGLWAYEIRVP